MRFSASKQAVRYWDRADWVTIHPGQDQRYRKGSLPLTNHSVIFIPTDPPRDPRIRIEIFRIFVLRVIGLFRQLKSYWYPFELSTSQEHSLGKVVQGNKSNARQREGL